MRVWPNFSIQSRHRQLLALIRSNLWRFIVAAVCMLTIAGATACMAYLIKPVIDDIFIQKDTARLLTFPLFIILVFFCKAAGSYGQEFFMNYIGEDIVRRLRNQLYDRIQDLPISFFQKERTGVLMSRITNDVNLLKSMVSTSVTASLRDSATAVGLIVVVFYQNWRMALISVVVLPVAFVLVYELGRRVRRVSTGCQEAMGDLNAFLHETLAGNKIVKAFGMEQHEKKRFFDRTNTIFHLEIKGVKVRALSSPIMEFFGGVAIAFTILYGGWEVIHDKSTLGQFMSFLTAAMMLYDPVRKLTSLNNAVQQGLSALDRVYDILEIKSEIQDPPAPMPLPRQPHQVSFHNVHFSYDENPVLCGIDLKANKGEVLALVGTSGGGKTTLVNLIPRFFEVSAGKICIDEIDIRQVRLVDLRHQIAVVTQEPILFNESIRDNIAYGNREATIEQIMAAAQAAFAHPFIEHLPNGYDTVIGELGGRLSGGEKQRLCIARALLKDAPILILDEATSSLDTQAEAEVQKALDNLMSGRTTFVIAHRLSTIARADQILVIDHGRVAERGRHEELLAAKGIYAELYHMQFDSRKPAMPMEGTGQS